MTTRQATWQQWLRDRIAAGRSRFDALAEDFDDERGEGWPNLFVDDSVPKIRPLLAGSGIGVTRHGEGVEFYLLEDLELAKDAYDLLHGAPDRAVECGAMLTLLRERGHDVSPMRVFRQAFVDLAIAGDLVEVESFVLVRGARRPR